LAEQNIEVNTVNESSLTNAGILFVSMESLSPGITSKIFSFIGEDRAKIMLKRIADLGKIEADNVNLVLEEFYDLAIEHKIIYGGKDISAKILKDSFGVAEHDEYFSEKVRVFEILDKVSNKMLLEYFENENLQLIALILNYVSDDRMAALMSKMTIDKAQQIFKILLDIKVPSQNLIWKFQNGLEEKFFGKKDPTETLEKQQLFKMARVIEMLGVETRIQIFELLSATNEQEAEKLKLLIFTFKDLDGIPNKDLETILYEIEQLKVIALALKDCSESLYDKVQSNISDRVKIMLEDEMDGIPIDIEKSQIEEAQRHIIQVARRLEKENKISKLVANHEYD
jgi:flagellar motor switch protein FliG